MAKNAMLEQLTALGCDTEGAMARTLGDADFYADCLNQCLDDDVFGALGDAIAAKDVRAAFEHAHNLKGVTGMLGLTPLAKISAALTETLRAGSLAGAEETYRAILNARETFDAALRACGERAGKSS